MLLTLLRQHLILATLASCLAAPLFSTAIYAQVRTVASTDTDPGTQPGEFFRIFRTIQLNDSGDVSFVARLQNQQGSLGFVNNFGIWNESQGQLRNVIRLNLEPLADPVFGPCGFGEFRLTNDNRTLFYAAEEVFTDDKTSISCRNPGLWSEDQGMFANTLDRSVPLDGAGGALSNSESGHATNKSGGFVFESMPIGFNRGIWFGDESGTKLIVARDTVVPAINGELRTFEFDTFSVFGGSYFVNELGSVAIHGQAASTDGQAPARREAVWLDNGALQLVAMAGGSIDNVPNGPVFSPFSTPFAETFTQIQLSDDGVFFVGLAEIGVGGITSDNDEGLYVFQDGSLRAIARDGQTAPGTNATFGATFRGTFQGAAVNRSGDIAFGANIGEPRGGVWVERDGVLEFVSRASFAFDADVAINANRQVAFLDLGVGLMAENVDGELISIAALGEPFEVAPGDFRTLTSVEFAGNSAFNDLGQIAFIGSFDDGSQGVFVSNAVMIPEPTWLGWLVCLVCFVAGRKRQSESVIRTPC